MCLFGKFYIVSTEMFEEINLYKFLAISWTRSDDIPTDKIIQGFGPVQCPLKLYKYINVQLKNKLCELGDESWYYLTSDDIEFIKECVQTWTCPEECYPLAHVSYKYIEETAQRWIKLGLQLTPDEFYTYFNMNSTADMIHELMTLPNADMKLISIEDNALEWFDRRSYKSGDFLLISTVNNSPGAKMLRRTSTTVQNIHYWYDTFKDRNCSQATYYDEGTTTTTCSPKLKIISNITTEHNHTTKKICCDSQASIELFSHTQSSEDLLQCAQPLDEFFQ